MPESEIEKQFHEVMHDSCDRWIRECGYRSARFMQMLSKYGGRLAAKTLLRSSKPAEGLTKLWELGRLDLSVEAYVCQDRWQPLFTPDEIAIATKHLSDLSYFV